MVERTHITLGPTPTDEPCEQLGENYNFTKARMECQVYKDQLYRQFENEFESRTNRSTVGLVVQGFDHPSGRYLEVVVGFDPGQEDDVELARKIEGGLPTHWDDAAKERLTMLGIL